MSYINGIGLISPQNTVGTRDFLLEIAECHSDYMKCIEPIYRNYIDPIQLRRMSRLIRMGISSARISLADAGCSMPEAIITGTGLGSVEDTEKILLGFVQGEKFLNPTPFIQSTYNTISSQVAIHLKCHHYNTTYVHRTFSFESGLLDGLMHLQEGSAATALVGGVDEMTLNHLNITRRIGIWKREPVNNLRIREYGTPGAMAGEGAAFFLIGKEAGEQTYAKLTGVKTAININGSYNPVQFVTDFLGRHGLTSTDIDLVVLGISGDINHDPVYHSFGESMFNTHPLAWYKHLCGEYHTSSAFALYIASQVLRTQTYPEILRLNDQQPPRLKNILIYNHYRNVNHSFILVQQAID